jgi:predicted RNase H-like nuclease
MGRGHQGPAKRGILWQVYQTARELVLASPSAQIIALDIPIGLPERGARDADLEARKLLGQPRGSSVFPAPIRAVLHAGSYQAACQTRAQVEGKKMSLQAWAIVPKIREVDDLLLADPSLQARVREVHPEVCFYYLAQGRPMRHSKKRRAGREERRALLEQEFGPCVELALAEARALGSGKDDMLDAFAALWTAERIARGLSVTLPASPPTDSFGLRMEIVA